MAIPGGGLLYTYIDDEMVLFGHVAMGRFMKGIGRDEGVVELDVLETLLSYVAHCEAPAVDKASCSCSSSDRLRTILV